MARPCIRRIGILWIVFILIPMRLWSAVPQGELLTKEGKVEATGQITNWAPAEVGLKLSVFDRLRTLALSRATVRLAELGRLRVDELTTMEILPPTQSAGKGIVDLKAGAVYIFTRDKPREFLLQTPHAIGASRGTEFVVEVDPAGRTVVTVFDGEVDLYNAQGSVTLTNGSQGTVLPGQAPILTPAIQATSVVQWWLYYPGVLDPDELAFTPVEQTALASSLAAYRSGDLLQALANYPAGRVATGDAERIYHAGLLLAVGQVDKAEGELNAIAGASPLISALHTVIFAVTGRGKAGPETGATASEWLARSYLQQPTNLQASLASARAATDKSPNFGFAWARVAELEFSFGRVNATDRALRKALELSPRNAQAIALSGFVLAAQNRISEAQQVFEQALEIDGALGNAWLGRGLCRIRQGDSEGGRADIQTAAALEPNRSLLRSYLGKAFDQVHDDVHAFKELDLAKRLDKNDPTPWLYSALIDYEQNRINDAVRSLEKSVELNDNRHVYRSELLLDQDRAVRSASLATIYQRAGLADVSVREAARAVADDYANYSAHLFLANSFDAFRDPTRFNLRYETAWFNELLLANLLASVGAGTFSQNISQQEYSRLFEKNRLGLVTTTDVRSDAQYRELTSQFGTIGNTSYSLDLDYQRNEGIRPNNELTRIEWYTQVKQQLTPQDTLFLLAKYQDYHSGDNFQYYDPTNVHRDFAFDEYQSPILVGGYHHEWAPGVHTLFLGGRLVSNQEERDRGVLLPVLSTNGNLQVVTDSEPFDARYDSDFETYTGELNQIFQTRHLTTILGTRLQLGEFETRNRLTAVAFPGFFQPIDTTSDDDFRRFSVYGYQTFTLDHLSVTAGLSYDQVTFPENFRQMPIHTGTDSRDTINPKAAIVWSPAPMLTVRGVYTRSLGGVSFDESFRLEPVQLAGFSQAFRTVIPESVAGSISAPDFETYGTGIDLKFPTGTYFGMQAELIQSRVDRLVGAFYHNNFDPDFPVVTPQSLDYEERTVSASVNQLIAREWSVGAQYRFSWAQLQTVFPELLPAVNPIQNTVERGELHQLGGYLLFNHPSGFFARADTQWYWQHNKGYDPALPGDSFVQVNAFLGYRFPRLHGEISLGVLNITDEDYRLNPLNIYAELPRERVFAARLRLNF